MAAAIGMPLFFSVRIVRERIPKFTPWPIEIVGLFVLAGWFFAQPASPLRLPGIIWIQWLLLLAALHCVAAVSAHFSRTESLSFWQFNRRLFVRFCLAILYTYAIKIIIIRSWPHGWVALPVLLLSGIGILAFLLLSSLRSRPEEKWARWFTTNFPRALAPLSVLLLISVLIRAREYGITEARYIGIVAALW